MWKFKFRVWDGFEMHYEGMMLPISGVYNEELIIQQFTGFQDKFGRDIYEGDIIEIETKEEHFVATIFRDDKSFNLELSPQVNQITLSESLENVAKIVANIFENENPTFYMP